MLAVINKWYSQSSNQVALGGFLAVVAAYFQGSVPLSAVISAGVGFLAVALKDQTTQPPKEPPHA